MGLFQVYDQLLQLSQQFDRVELFVRTRDHLLSNKNKLPKTAKPRIEPGVGREKLKSEPQSRVPPKPLNQVPIQPPGQHCPKLFAVMVSIL